ncbi:DUF3918 family protein [Desulfatibacillum alkenivorans]
MLALGLGAIAYDEARPRNMNNMRNHVSFFIAFPP